MDQSTMPNAIVFNSPIELLAALLFLVLLVAALGWACYRLGRSGERSWRDLLARLPLGVGVYDTASQRMTFANPVAHDMLGQLDPAVLDQARQVARQHQQLSWTVGGDDGPGIDPRDLPYLFDTLYRAEQHQQIQGSGLGLAIVRQIVELHGGQISCQNNDEVGHGAIFRIRLPLVQYVM